MLNEKKKTGQEYERREQLKHFLKWHTYVLYEGKNDN